MISISYFNNDDDGFWESSLHLHKKRIDTGVVAPVMHIFDHCNAYGLQERTGQTDMALEIAEAIRDKNHAMIEAGVGIGKSLGYLIPGLLAQRFLKGAIIIATSSISLSEQLMTDITQARHIISDTLGKEYLITSVLAKGANNYVCPKKVFDNMLLLSRHSHKSGGVFSVPSWIWDEASSSKERSDFSRPVPDRFWKYVNGEPCHIRECTYRSECSYMAMRNAIGNGGAADVIVINQDMFIISLLKELRGRNGMLTSRRGLIVVDEAHNLEDKTRNALTERWTKARMLKAVEGIGPAVSRLANEEYITHLSVSLEAIEKYFMLVQKRIEREISVNHDKKDATRFYVPNVKETVLARWTDVMDRLYIALSGRYSLSSGSDDAIDEFGDFAEMIKSLALRNTTESNRLFWVEGDHDKPDTYALCTAPKRIDMELRQLLFSQSYTPVVLTSATLCQPGATEEDQYRYLVQSTGFSGETYAPKPSPFPYDTNAMLYIPADIEDPVRNREKYLADITERIIELCCLTRGRTLVLFTAKEDLRVVYDSLITRRLPWKILKQVDGGSQASIKDEFIQTKGVLLATGLWEGFNVKGPDLSSVIITRLPFPVPDPIIDYKISLAPGRLHVLVPEMLVKLRQGAGRLIRDDKDTGLLSILDPRVSKKSRKPYVKDVLSSLSIKNATDSLAIIEMFCRDVIVSAK